MRKMDEKKIRITHGVFLQYGSYQVPTGKVRFFCRNTETYLPLPVKFQELIERFYKKWWQVKVPVSRFGKTKYITTYFDVPVEFTIAYMPFRDLMVISITHPSDTFKRATGVKLVKQRIEWALNNPHKKRTWKNSLLGDN